MEKLSPKQVKEKLDSASDQICFIDVRSENEFQSGHVPGATCIPLSLIESGQAQIPPNKTVILGCQGGVRSAKAKQMLLAKGYKNLLELEGGFAAWASAGLPVNKTKNVMPIFRQVLLTAGLIILTSSVLALTVHPKFVFVPLFMSAGLTFAGATGWCGLVMLLEKMPWNR